MYVLGTASFPLSREPIVIDARDRGEELAESLGDDRYGDGDFSCNVEEYDSSDVCCNGETSREVRRRLRDEWEAGDRDRLEDISLLRRSCRLS